MIKQQISVLETTNTSSRNRGVDYRCTQLITLHIKYFGENVRYIELATKTKEVVHNCFILDRNHQQRMFMVPQLGRELRDERL